MHSMNLKNISKAIIPVAGLGTRMLPITKEVPKELLPIFDKPLIQHVVEEAVSVGISEIIFVKREGKNLVKDYFSKNTELEKSLKRKKKDEIIKRFPNHFLKKIKFSYINQKKPLGLGDAILTAKDFIQNESFAVFLPDELLISKNLKLDFERMIDNHLLNGKSQILVEKISRNLVSQYGIVKLQNNKLTLKEPADIVDIIEKPSFKEAPSKNRVVGRYILSAKIFENLLNTKPGKNNEIQLTDAIKDCLNKNKLSFQATLSNSEIYDCGSLKGFVGANIALSLKDRKIKKYIKEIF